MQAAPKEKVEGYSLIIGYLGIICIMVGFIIMLPLLLLFLYPDEIIYAKNFLLPGGLSIVAGYFMTLPMRGKEQGQLARNQDTIIVVLAWLIAIGVSTIPFTMTGQYTFTQAFFECTSGYSTTGLSVVDVASAPRIYLIFRTAMLFFGGVGLLLVIMSVLSDSHGMRLYVTEGHSDKLLPNLVQSARIILAIYMGYILSGTLMYMLFGMDWFDAFNHSVAALSTGGFSTRPESIGYYNSTPINIITIILMMLGATNFLVHLLLLKGKLKETFFHCESQFSLFVYGISVPVLTVFLVMGFSKTIPNGFLTALFQAVSAITTTGFQTIDNFNNWSSPMLLIMVILMLIGGEAGSTAGGLKLYRVYIMMKEVIWSLRNKLCNRRVIQICKISRCGEVIQVTDEEKRNTSNFVFLYLLIFLAGTFIFSCFGYSVEQSMFEFASSMSTVGLSVGITNYNANPIIHWTSTLGMFFGRLELYIILLAAVRLYSDARIIAVSKLFQRNHPSNRRKP